MAGQQWHKRPETDENILRNRVALGYAALNATFELDYLATARQRERWATDRGFLADHRRTRRILARLWQQAFREGGIR